MSHSGHASLRVCPSLAPEKNHRKNRINHTCAAVARDPINSPVRQQSRVPSAIKIRIRIFPPAAGALIKLGSEKLGRDFNSRVS